MSLDVYLIKKNFLFPSRCVFEYNITHNLSKMAREAGIYECLWRPEEVKIERAHQLIIPLTKGLDKLESAPHVFKSFNPENGWGEYQDLIKFVRKYLEACRKFPMARVEAHR